MHGRLARSIAPMFLVMATLAPNSVQASGPQVPGSGGVIELEHAIELSAAPEGATLHITRTLFNAAPSPAQVEVPIPLPCTAALDEVAIEERGEGGQMRRRAADLLDVDDAAARWSAWLDGPGDDVMTVVDADTALHLERWDHDCSAVLSIYPIPSLHTRKVWYRVFVPSRYVGGQYVIEVPSFDAHGEIAKLTLAGWRDEGFEVQVDGIALGEANMSLVGDQVHAISLRRRDSGQGIMRAADVDVAGRIANLPAAAARLEVDEVPGRLLATTFEAPRQLATLPPVRRVVVLLDASRSLASWQREPLQQAGSQYLEQLAETRGVEVEIVLFDRELRRIYHDFVPAAWAAEDLRDLDVASGNGSELGAAIAGARELLGSPSAREGADWILVLGDLYLRSSFPLGETLDGAAQSAVRMHVVRPHPDDDAFEFRPGPLHDPWSLIAREAGGMLWHASTYELEALARELIAPTRIWSPRLELALAGNERREVLLGDWHMAGESNEWLDGAHQQGALERAVFVGEVWGQRRAWSATSTDEEARRTAGRLATQEEPVLSDAARTALANFAQVVSPFTSAWAVAGFGGPAEAPMSGYGSGGFGGRSISTRCGGGFASGYGHNFASATIEELTRGALEACPDAEPGTLEFEATDLEIVDVVTEDPCIREQIWALDISPTRSTGRHLVRVRYEGGGKLVELTGTTLGYRDLTMPTPNITTNTASGRK